MDWNKVISYPPFRRQKRSGIWYTPWRIVQWLWRKMPKSRPST